MGDEESLKELEASRACRHDVASNGGVHLKVSQGGLRHIFRRVGGIIKGVWSQNEEVKEKVKEKHDASAALIDSRTDEEKEVNLIKYQTAKKIAKKVVTIAKKTTHMKGYIKKSRQRKVRQYVFKLARVREKKQETWKT